MAIPSEGVSDFDIGWLAGVVDSDGSIAFYKAKNHDRRRGKHIIRYSRLTRIVIINTDVKILRRVANILTKLNIVAYINQKSASKKFRDGSFHYKKPCYEIIVSQRKSAERIANIIYPHLAGYKKDKVLTIVKYYETHPFNAGRKTPRVETKRLAPDSNIKRLDEAIVRSHIKI